MLGISMGLGRPPQENVTGRVGGEYALRSDGPCMECSSQRNGLNVSFSDGG